MFDTNMTNPSLTCCPSSTYPALNPQSNKTRQNERNDVPQIAANGGPNQSTHMETLEMETLQKNSWVYGTELKWSKTAYRPKLLKLSKLVECGLEWSNMIKIVQMV